MLLSVRAESNQRRAKGAPSTNTWLTPVFIGVVPQTPDYGGRPPGKWAILFGGQRQDRWSFLPRALGPLCAKFGEYCAVRTPPTLAKPWQLARLRPPPRRAEPQKQSEALQKVLLPTFLTRKVGALVPGLGRERLRKRFVVPPNFRTGRPRSLSPLCCGRGDRARLRARW